MDWCAIETVLLDMDGTLLDLYFDSYLWKQHLPLRYAERHGIDVESAKREIVPKIKAKEGSLQWYCLDYWTCELGVDISFLEREVGHLIALRPHVTEFLDFLRRRELQVALTTNAHRRSLDHKLARTGLTDYFDAIVSSHDFGIPKEERGFWQRLHTQVDYDPATTLLIDDNPNVLRAALAYGIQHLRGIALPDSRAAPRRHDDFLVIESFLDLLPQAGLDTTVGQVADSTP